MDLFAATNMSGVTSDPNEIPPNTYEGLVSSSSLVYFPDKDILQHVINYRVTEGPHKGAERGEFYPILAEPRLANGYAPEKGRVAIEQVAKGTPNLPDSRKPWYRKRMEELTGSTEDAVIARAMNNVTTLENIPVVFTVTKSAAGYLNIGSAKKRDSQASTAQAATSLGSPASFNSPASEAPSFASEEKAKQDAWQPGAPVSLEGF